MFLCRHFATKKIIKCCSNPMNQTVLACLFFFSLDYTITLRACIQS